jgi:uncharacterized RDD family membrane protein YckC
MSNPYAPPQATVHDIVDSRETAAVADRGTRLGAVILDTIIAGVMFTIPMTIGFVVVLPMARTGDQSARTAALWLAIGLGSIGFALWGWLTYKYVKANGQTIGKKLLGIKVVRRDGSPATVGRIFWLRNVVNGLLGIVPMYGLIDSLFIFAESRQCIHDKLADTIVVKA